MSAAWRIVMRRPGGVEVLEREAFDPGDPGPGEVRVKISASGLNFIDTYHRSGLYPLALPTGLGTECAGVLEAVGADVTDFVPGQRVAVLMNRPGSYATHAVVSADQLFRIPDAISDEIAAAVMLKGLTAWMLLEKCRRLQAGQTVLIHAAAGGVGSLLVPWAKALGGLVIAHAGSAEKAERARAAGAGHAFSCDFNALASKAREVTDGRGVDLVLDGVGAASWSASLAAIAPRGLIVSYGNASGPVPPVAPLELARAGSAFLTRPTVYDYIRTAEERAEGSARLFDLIVAGTLPIAIGQRFALDDVATAHSALEARKTTGATILIP